VETTDEFGVELRRSPTDGWKIMFPKLTLDPPVITTLNGSSVPLTTGVFNPTTSSSSSASSTSSSSASTSSTVPTTPTSPTGSTSSTSSTFSCNGVDCSTMSNTHCEVGVCVCNDGTVMENGMCVAEVSSALHLLASLSQLWLLLVLSML